MNPGFRMAIWLVAGLVLGGAPLLAITVASPLTFPSGRGIGVERAIAAGDRLVELRPAVLATLRSVAAHEPVRLEQFPFAPDATGDLLLERFDVVSPGAQIVVRGARGETSVPLAPGVHFQGRLEGDPESRVYLGIPGEFVVAIVRTSAGFVSIGPEGPTQGPVQHVLRRSDSPRYAELAPADWHCDVEDLPQAPIGPEFRSRGGESLPTRAIRPAAALSAEAVTATKEAAISIETDQEFLAKFGGNTASMSNYVTTLIAQGSLIYQRDVSVRLTINRLQAWTSTDPYAAGDPRTQLDEVGDWWHGNRPKASYPRTTVLFLSGKPVSGGIAWLDVLCLNDFSQGGHWGGAYAVVQAMANWPSNLWDLLATTHELGHNFGSPHTHCFSPPIDKCYGSEPGCYSGPTVNPGPLGGTIMSYCHLLAGGYANIDMRFHDRCINEQMLPEINSVACLTTVSDPPPTASTFFTLPPCRLIDTRNPAGPLGGPALAANTSRSFVVSGTCGIPSTATAISVNVVATAGTAAGLLRVFPTGVSIPNASTINYAAGKTRANNDLAKLSTGSALTIRCEQASGSVQAIIDVNGYFQ